MEQKSYPDRDKEFVKLMQNLPEDKINKMLEFSESLTAQYEAQASMESQKKLRVLFERTAVEHLPFVVYCVYVGVWGAISVFHLTAYTGEQLRILGVLVALVMILPLFTLPKIPLKSSIKKLFSGNKDE